MKIIIKKENLSVSPEQITRRAGYGFIYDKEREKGSFTRHPFGSRYPRFHMYIMAEEDKIIFDLHLDQKQASYSGSHMHNAEYDGEAVEREIARLKQIISRLYQEAHGSIVGAESSSKNSEENLEDKIGHAEFDKNIQAPQKKSWWKIWS